MSGSSFAHGAVNESALSAARSPSAAATPAPVVSACTGASARPGRPAERWAAGMDNRSSIHAVEVGLVRLVNFDAAAIFIEVVSALDQDRALV